MYNSKLQSHNRVFRHQYHLVFGAVSAIMFLLLLTSVQAAVGKEVTGIVKEAPGVSWPFGTWMVEDKEVMVTEQTVIKGDPSKAHFGAKITVKGSRVNGLFTAYELEVRTDDGPMFADN